MLNIKARTTVKLGRDNFLGSPKTIGIAIGPLGWLWTNGGSNQTLGVASKIHYILVLHIKSMNVGTGPSADKCLNGSTSNGKLNLFSYCSII